MLNYAPPKRTNTQTNRESMCVGVLHIILEPEGLNLL